jgi:SAM-dependent methyltransferase
MVADAASQAADSVWLQRLARGAGSCCLLGWGPGQAVEGFWRDVFSTTRPGSSVLEIGCGAADVSVWAAEAGKQLRIVASDIHDRPELIRQHPDVTFLGHAYAEALPAPAASFDLVVSNFAFEYAADRPRAAAELARVLRPGGGGTLVLHSDDSTFTAGARGLLNAHEELLRAGIPGRVGRAAALRPDHLTRRKLLKDVLKLRGALPERPSGLSARLYFDLAERLLKAEPAAQAEVEALNRVAASLVEISTAQIGAALDRAALARLAGQFSAQGLEVHTSEITGTYESRTVEKVGWLIFLTKRL